MQIRPSTTSAAFQTLFPRVGGVFVGSDHRFSKKQRRFVRKAVSLLSTVLIVVAVLSGGVVFGPGVATTLFPTSQTWIESNLSGSVFGGSFAQGATRDETADVQANINGTIAFQPAAEQAAGSQQVDRPTQSAYLPEKNETLPEGSWISIPKIGVRTQLQWTEDEDEALKTGVWAVPEYGRPGDPSMPMIAAAHRFGYDFWWNSDYWKYHSFNLLPDLEPGDIVEVIHDQRKWTYEVYAGELNQEITDYNADLILYTCRFLTGDDRHIRYARVIDMSQDSQRVGD